MFKKNPFGHYLILKKWLIRYLGFMTHRRYRGFNQLHIEGSEIIKNLPNEIKKNKLKTGIFIGLSAYWGLILIGTFLSIN